MNIQDIDQIPLEHQKAIIQMHTETLKKEIAVNNLKESQWKIDTARTIFITAIVSGIIGYYFVYLNNAKDIEIANLKGQIVQLSDRLKEHGGDKK